MRLPPRARARRASLGPRALRAWPVLLLLASCGMLDARLEARTACFTLPDFVVSGATGTGQLSTDLEFDLGSALPVLSEPGVSYRLWLRDVTLDLASSSSLADLGGLDAFTVSPIPPADSALPAPELVRYERSAGGDPAPARITAPASGEVDLAPYVADGWLRLGATAAGTLPRAPWRASVTSCFVLEVDVEYGDRI